jgi:hypothetical protein
MRYEDNKVLVVLSGVMMGSFYLFGLALTNINSTLSYEKLSSNEKIILVTTNGMAMIATGAVIGHCVCAVMQ